MKGIRKDVYPLREVFFQGKEMTDFLRLSLLVMKYKSMGKL